MPRTAPKESVSNRALRSTRSFGVQKPSTPPTSRKRRTRNIRVEGQYKEGHVQTQPGAGRKPKKALASYFQPSQNEASDPNRRAALFTVPVEMLRAISSHLPPASAVCLTLTCKLAVQTLGTTSWNDERVRRRRYLDYHMGRHHRSSLIELLFHDLRPLDMIYCERCTTIHGPLKRPSAHRETKLTKYCWGQDAIIDYYPKSELGGYSLVFDHIKHVIETTSPNSSCPIEYLSGSFQIPNPNLHYTLSTSSRGINGNIIIRHDYVFRTSSPKMPLKVTDVLGLPLRICPHQSTTTMTPPSGRYTRNPSPNGPLFTHSIAYAFPVSQRTGVPQNKIFRKPTPLEEQMLRSLDLGEEKIMRCRCCPTKWDVNYSEARASSTAGRGELTITVWHCLYSQLYMAARVWPWFVRREGQLLGKSKMNTEFWSQTRSFADFKTD
ncbi:hypothetical protein TruAng_001606 [Truncatella angustata]|nr:hypothetical protein TruAng_001606 [Truncatella angustata]